LTLRAPTERLRFHNGVQWAFLFMEIQLEKHEKRLFFKLKSWLQNLSGFEPETTL
jgi:hypothetical protein